MNTIESKILVSVLDEYVQVCPARKFLMEVEVRDACRGEKGVEGGDRWLKIRDGT